MTNDVKEKNEMIEVKGSFPKLIPNEEFRQFLDKIPDILKKADKATKVDIDTLDENEIEDLTKQFKDIQPFVKEGNESRKQMKKYLNNQTDVALKALDKAMNDKGFDQLIDADKKIKQLKKDISSNRINKHWSELKPTFDENIALYPIITKLAPELADYSMFRVKYPKLVTGAKTFKITDKIRTEVNQTIFEWNRALTVIEENEQELTPTNEFEVLKGFKQDPKLDTVYNLEKSFKEKQKADELIQKQQLANKQKQSSNDTTKSSKPIVNAPRPKSTETLQWLIDYIFSIPGYRNISNNDKVKSAVIYDLVHQLDDKNSLMSQKTGNDPNEFMKAMRFIISN